MRELVIDINEGNQRLDRFLRKKFASVPASTLQKWLREKRIKVNGVRAKGEVRIFEGDRLELYVRDEFFEATDDENAFLLIENPDLHIIYEDENILLLDKPSGLLCHSDAKENVNTLLSRLQAYLYQKGEFTPNGTFAPSLCNRIDRNTRGIVIAAKNAEALRVMSEKIRAREVKKFYLCEVHGTPEPRDGVLTGYILRDLKLARVFVFDKPRAGAKYAETIYRTIERRADRTLVECRLVTGRTHQIRAQMAHAGCPLVGDGKYGKAERGEKDGQRLVSYKIQFEWADDAGILGYLNSLEFEIDADI